MTEKFRDLLDEQASSVRFRTTDLAAVEREGRRRARAGTRRRAAVALAGVGAAAGLVVVGWGAGGGAPDHGLDPASEAPVTAAPSWTTGSLLHGADGPRDLGHVVRAYVRTSVGFVVADTEGVVWSVTGDDVVEVGRTSAADPRLASDPAGAHAGWVDPTDARPGFVVLDQAAGTTWSDDSHTAGLDAGPADGRDLAHFHAIDGDTAYWLDGRGLVAVDVVSRAARVVDADATTGFDLVGAGSGQLLTQGRRGAVLTRADGERLVLDGAYGSRAAFSPDGTLVSLDADSPAVFDTATGRRVDGLAEGYAFATGYEWLDDSTLALIARRGPAAPPELLTCTVPAASCTSVTELAPFDELDDPGAFALPVGEPIDG